MKNKNIYDKFSLFLNEYSYILLTKEQIWYNQFDDLINL